MNSVSIKPSADPENSSAGLSEAVQQNVVPLPPPHPSSTKFNHDVAALVGVKLTLEAFNQLCGKMAGYPFVKIVVDRTSGTIHFINHARYPFHIDYAAEKILGMTQDQLFSNLDACNRSVYQDPNRRCYLGLIALHNREGRRFFTLETVEVDTMNSDMLKYFYDFTKDWLDSTIPLVIKPANHQQEGYLAQLDPIKYPRVYNHELFASENFIALNNGIARGRLRAFADEAGYRKSFQTIEWYDVVCMPRVPDDIPRVAGIINARHTTPLSHTNVLAHGWQIPNAIQIGAMDEIRARNLDGRWVEYQVDRNNGKILLTEIDAPEKLPEKPRWTLQEIKLEPPETRNTPIENLENLRASDRFRYGTKAANLGEMHYVLRHGSERLLGYYRIKRPPRENLMPYLAAFLEAPESAEMSKTAWHFLKDLVRVPRGVAIPFSVQQEFLESSPQIQQTIGKLKMALELKARDIDPLCYQLQTLIRNVRLSDRLREYVDAKIAEHLGGVSSFVVRSSSNAEDLDGFSAAGIYESINHVTTAENIFKSIKEVWASLLSARSVRLRHDVGISLDDSYMGVIVQEEVPMEMGGVLVSSNPSDPAHDFRNVYVNVSVKSVIDVVQGSELPFQYLFNTVEGNGRTLSIGDAKQDLSPQKKTVLQKLAFASRLLQSHFSPDYTFATPVDIEWAWSEGQLHVLQLRPYAR
jgi:hypothetical protein